MCLPRVGAPKVGVLIKDGLQTFGVLIKDGLQTFHLIVFVASSKRPDFATFESGSFRKKSHYIIQEWPEHGWRTNMDQNRPL